MCVRSAYTRSFDLSGEKTGNSVRSPWTLFVWPEKRTRRARVGVSTVLSTTDPPRTRWRPVIFAPQKKNRGTRRKKFREQRSATESRAERTRSGRARGGTRRRAGTRSADTVRWTIYYYGRAGRDAKSVPVHPRHRYFRCASPVRVFRTDDTGRRSKRKTHRPCRVERKPAVKPPVGKTESDNTRRNHRNVFLMTRFINNDFPTEADSLKISTRLSIIRARNTFDGKHLWARTLVIFYSHSAVTTTRKFRFFARPMTH